MEPGIGTQTFIINLHDKCISYGEYIFNRNYYGYVIKQEEVKLDPVIEEMRKNLELNFNNE